MLPTPQTPAPLAQPCFWRLRPVGLPIGLPNQRACFAANKQGLLQLPHANALVKVLDPHPTQTRVATGRALPACVQSNSWRLANQHQDAQPIGQRAHSHQSTRVCCAPRPHNAHRHRHTMKAFRPVRSSKAWIEQARRKTHQSYEY